MTLSCSSLVERKNSCKLASASRQCLPIRLSILRLEVAKHHRLLRGYHWLHEVGNLILPLSLRANLFSVHERADDVYITSSFQCCDSRFFVARNVPR